jgi:hypothetical protein
VLVHNPSQPGFGILKMLLEGSGTLFQLSGTEQLVHLSVHRNERPRIVMTAVDQYHADSKLADHVFVKRIQALVPMEAY